MKKTRGLGVLLKVFSERKYEVVNRARAGKNIIAPYCLQYLIATNHLVLALSKELEQHGFFFGECDFFTPECGGFKSFKVDFVAAKFKQGQ